MLKYVLISILFINCYACKNAQQGSDKEKHEPPKQLKTSDIAIVSPQNGQQVRQSEIIDISYQIKNDSLTIDTTVLFVNNKTFAEYFFCICFILFCIMLSG